MKLYIKNSNLIIKYKNYDEYLIIGKAPHAKWDKDNKVWIINDYKSYLPEIEQFVNDWKSYIDNPDIILKQQVAEMNSPVRITDKTIYISTGIARKMEDNFFLEDLTYKRMSSGNYYQIPNSIGTRRILRKKFSLDLSDDFKMRDVEIDDDLLPDFLYPHQVEGVKWLLSQYKKGYNGSLLADDMGLGKTIQTLAFYHVLKSVKPNLKLFIVATKSTLKNSWANDLQKFFKEESHVLSTDDLRNGVSYDKPVIINYEALSYVYDENPTNLPVLSDDFILVLDEATKIKNAQTRIFKSINHLRGNAFVLALTGTPVENNLGEYYTILRTIQPDFLPQFIFNRIFVEYETLKFGNKTVHRIAGHKNLDLFHAISKDFVLRRTKSILQMPTKKINAVIAPLTDEQKRLIDVIIDKAKQRLNETIAKYATLTIIKRISDHPKLLEMGDTELGKNVAIYDYTAPKLNMLKKLVEETKKPVVIFTEYEDMAELIREELAKKYKTTVITGAHSGKQRNQIIQDFKNGVYEILIATDALAYGVNLQFANTLINYDIPWNPAKRAQRIDRIHRLGIKEEKVIYDIVSEGLELRAYKMLTNKLEIFAKAVEGQDSIMTSSLLKQLSDDYFDIVLDN